jgi:serine/threonine protein kinase
MNYGRYQIIKEIGRGSMGVVYQAHDPNLDLTVALKVLRQDRVVSEAFVKRFLSEAKALGRLDHPNIIRVYNVDKDNGNIYIAMEYIDGESLNEIMQQKKLTPEEIIELGTTVADALDYAHQKGIVHRDIKPSNILIRSDGRVKITDFGIAHVEDPSASIQTQAGEILGTPAYMSPEQVLSKPVDGRSDIFSLGIVLYELVAGKRPFEGESLAAIFNAITQIETPPVKNINPDIPEKLSQIIFRCLQKSPEERFDTARAMAEALKDCLRKETTAVSVEQQSEPKKSRSLVLAIVVILVIGIGLAAYYHFKPQPPPVEEETRMASLKIESTPVEAQVFVDGAFKGKTPLTIDLLLGKHEVKLTSSGYYDWEAQVQLQQEGETPLFVRLIPIEKKEEGIKNIEESKDTEVKNSAVTRREDLQDSITDQEPESPERLYDDNTLLDTVEKDTRVQEELIDYDTTQKTQESEPEQKSQSYDFDTSRDTVEEDLENLIDEMKGKIGR